MFFGPSSRAIDCATARSPNLALAKAAKPLPPRKDAVAPVKKMLPWPRGSISRAASRPETKPAQQAISQTFRNTRSVVSRIGKLTLAPTLKMQTSSGACLSASLRKAVTSSSLRASRCFDLLHQRLELGAIASPCEHGKTFGGESLRDLAPDIVAGTDHRA